MTVSLLELGLTFQCLANDCFGIFSDYSAALVGARIPEAQFYTNLANCINVNFGPVLQSSDADR